MSDTPETDKERKGTDGDYYLDGYVCTEFAERLERERDQARSANYSRLVDLCKELIGYLEVVEESDSGREFNPTTISSCRCLVMDRLGKIIPEIKSICENDE